MFNETKIRKLQADSRTQSLEISTLRIWVERLEETIDKIKEELVEIRKECRKEYHQLSDWDDLRRAEIRALADAAGLEIHRGTHLVAKEEE